MPVKTNEPASHEGSAFWDFNLTKKIISGLLFFLGGLICSFLLIAYFRANLKTAAELILPGVLVLIWALVVFQLFRRKNGFVLILFALTLLGMLAGWGLRSYTDQLNEQKIIVLVLRFDGEEDQYAIREKVLKELKASTKEISNVEIIVSDDLVTREQGSLYARQLGEKVHADIVIWAWYQGRIAPRANLFIEDVTPAALEIPQPQVAAQVQPILAYLTAFETRYSFASKTDTLTTLMSALLNYKSGNYQVFLDRFAQILSEKDASIYVVPYDLNFYIGVSHSLRKETDLAIESYTQALKNDRKGAASYTNRALAYIDQQQYDLAIKDCTTAVVIDSKYTPPYNTRSIAYLALGQYKDAIKDLDIIILHNPNEPRAYHNRALAYQALGQTDFAAADFKKEAELRANQ